MVSSADSNDADIVIGDFRMVSDECITLYSSGDFWRDGKETSLNKYISSVWTTAWGSIVKRSVYEKNTI